MKVSSNKPKLLVILSRVPEKLDKGDKLRAFYQLKELSKSCHIHLICLNADDDSKDLKELLEICKEVYVFNISKWSKFWNLFLAIFSSNPYQVAYFYNSKIKKNIERITKEVKPDHIYAQLIRTSEYVKNFHGITKTLDYMDAFSKGIERRVEDANIFLKPLFRSEHKRLLKYESLIFEYFENKTIISEVDREFIFHVDRTKIKVIGNGIDQAFFDFSEKWGNQEKALFTGNMSYAPNIKAAEFISSDIANEFNDINFVIAGANPEGLKNINFSQNIEVTGWVEDIKEVYRDCKIFIAPMFIGTGVQNKLLEAMAMGLPCITTDLANKPLGAKADKEILIANSKQEFIDQIKKLNSNKEIYTMLSVNGQEFVKKNYSWEESTSQLAEIMLK